MIGMICQSYFINIVNILFCTTRLGGISAQKHHGENVLIKFGNLFGKSINVRKWVFIAQHTWSHTGLFWLHTMFLLRTDQAEGFSLLNKGVRTFFKASLSLFPCMTMYKTLVPTSWKWKSIVFLYLYLFLISVWYFTVTYLRPMDTSNWNTSFATHQMPTRPWKASNIDIVSSDTRNKCSKIFHYQCHKFHVSCQA